MQRNITPHPTQRCQYEFRQKSVLSNIWTRKRGKEAFDIPFVFKMNAIVMNESVKI